MLAAAITLAALTAVSGAVGLEPGEPPTGVESSIPPSASPVGGVMDAPGPGGGDAADTSGHEMAGSAPADPGFAAFVFSLVLGALASVAASVADARVRREELLASMPKAPGDVIVVLVGGYGSGYGAEFQHLIAALGLGDSQVAHFDYRWPSAQVSHVHATEAAAIAGVAGSLEAFIAGLSRAGSPIYLIGFSKGGAAVAHLVADWDANGGRAADRVVGAALLDPPLADGAGGLVQSLGSLVPLLPNDGGYAPIRCEGGCRDTRAHLGEASGVAVTVFRNPDASVANFTGSPPGMRVFDIDDGRPPPARHDLAGISSAHRFALVSAAVASCIGTEMAEPGSCEFDEEDSRSLALQVGE